MNSKKRKSVMTGVAAALILALGLAGTYAWSGGEESDGDINGTVDVSVRLHDDYDMLQTGNLRDRDIYVENTGESALYIRVRLDEYLELGGRKLISGSEQNDKTTWNPHIPATEITKHCSAGFHDYFTWEMGNDTPVDYASDIRNWYTGGKPAKTKQSGTATVITMSAYMNAPDNAKPTDCWIIDEKDGYAYWSTQLIGKAATGLLLNGIEISNDLDESYIYKVNAKLEAVTEIDVMSWINDAETTDGNKMNRASESAAKFLKDISPSYIRITEGMNLTTPKASDFDADRDGYLTKAENKEYGKVTGTVKINEAMFNDNIFRNYVSENFDTDRNGALTQDELQTITTLDVSNQGITSLKGIENFTSLTSLDCSNNKITSLNLSNNINLVNVTADNQAVDAELKYEMGIAKYKSQKGLFVSGTTFGAGDVVLDEKTGAIMTDTYTPGKTSTFSLPISFGRTKALGSLSGTVSFKAPSARDLVKAAKVGDIIALGNKDGSCAEWIILTKNATQAELLRKEMVTSMKYANEGVTTFPKWSESAIRTYLNGAFYNTLSEDVQNSIKEETNLMTPTVYDDFSKKEATSDKVYLLSEDTNMTVITPSGKNLTLDAALKEFLKCSSTTSDKKTEDYWWLRSPCYSSEGAANIICENGEWSAYPVNYVRGVRPAVTLNLQ